MQKKAALTVLAGAAVTLSGLAFAVPAFAEDAPTNPTANPSCLNAQAYLKSYNKYAAQLSVAQANLREAQALRNEAYKAAIPAGKALAEAKKTAEEMTAGISGTLLNLKSKMAQAKQNIAGTKTQIAALAAPITALNAKIKTQNGVIKTLENNLKQDKQDYGPESPQAKKDQTGLDKAKEALSLLQAQLSSKSDLSNRLNTQLAAYQANLDALSVAYGKVETTAPVNGKILNGVGTAIAAGAAADMNEKQAELDKFTQLLAERQQVVRDMEMKVNDASTNYTMSANNLNSGVLAACIAAMDGPDFAAKQAAASAAAWAANAGLAPSQAAAKAALGAANLTKAMANDTKVVAPVTTPVVTETKPSGSGFPLDGGTMVPDTTMGGHSVLGVAKSSAKDASFGFGSGLVLAGAVLLLVAGGTLMVVRRRNA